VRRRSLAAAFAVAIAAVLSVPIAAHATEDGPSYASCANLAGWGVPDDEQAGKPKSTVDGLEFGNASNIHHATSLDLADVKPGSFDTVGAVTGSKPLFKVWTTNPFTTFNLVYVDGKPMWWATAMTYEQDGGQGHPLASLDLFVGKDVKPGKPKLTGDTKAVEFGVGYGNDTGNKAVVSSITFHGKTYDLTCEPKPEPTKTSGSPSPSASASSSATAKPSASASSSSAAGTGLGDNGTSGGGLPVTGAAAGGIAGGAAVLLVAGGVLFVMARRRKVKFTA
jgi:hypothetical protein